jgi:hypothetical protein
MRFAGTGYPNPDFSVISVTLGYRAAGCVTLVATALASYSCGRLNTQAPYKYDKGTMDPALDVHAIYRSFGTRVKGAK